MIEDRQLFDRLPHTISSGRQNKSYEVKARDGSETVGSDGDTVRNWAGNVTYQAARFHRPESLDELRKLVAASRRLRVLGSGHSFNRIADTTGDLVSLERLPRGVSIDPERGTATVAAGMRYGEVAAHLQAASYALPNLGSLPHISVAGACATGTHGSGDRNGNLATAVTGLRLVTAEGDLLDVDRDTDPDRFPGMVVNLGALGVVTEVTLAVVPTFQVRQYVYEGLPRAGLAERFEEIMSRAYSVSVFTDWADEPAVAQVWLKLRDGEEPPPPRWLDATRAAAPRHPIPGMPAENCTGQLGEPGPWHERLPHFRLEFTPSNGDELQTEYFVPRQRAAEAIAAVASLRHLIAPVLQISELRTIAADDLWLSPCHGRDSVGFHFTWRQEEEPVMAAVAALDEALAPLAARPHWGKLFTTPPEALAARYPRYDDFRRLRAVLDPAGVFANEFTGRYVPAPTVEGRTDVA